MINLQMYNWLSVRDFGYGQASSDVQLATVYEILARSSDVQLAKCTRFWP